MKTITFVTSNKFKIFTANTLLKSTGIKVIGKKILCPEIQHQDVTEIAKQSAKCAVEKLQTPVIVHDCGFCIEAFNGFPGAFIAYVERWLGFKGFLKLMNGVKNRRAKFVDAVAYCEPGKDPVVFMSETHGTLSKKQQGKYGWGIDHIFIPKGKNKTLGCFPDEERAKLCSGEHWKEFAEYLKKR